jgi:hypothetical protein
MPKPRVTLPAFWGIPEGEWELMAATALEQPSGDRGGHNGYFQFACEP